MDKGAYILVLLFASFYLLLGAFLLAKAFAEAFGAWWRERTPRRVAKASVVARSGVWTDGVWRGQSSAPTPQGVG